MNEPTKDQTSSLFSLHPTAISPDVETFCFDMALMAPPIVCAQWAKFDKAGEVYSNVEVTKNVEDAGAWIFSREHEQIWLHNGPYDIACFLEWYPKLSPLVWKALDDGRIYDTMGLQRLIQIFRGEIGGPLGLEPVCSLWGIPPPDKEQYGTHPDYPGIQFDVRKSFGLWYMADEIPDPWYTYADYDGIATLRLAGRQMAKYGTGATPAVTQAAQQWLVRRSFCLHLERTYGLHVRQDSVRALASAAQIAIGNLREAAVVNGFLKPEAATRAQVAAGQTTGEMICPARYEHPPKDGDPKKMAAYERRQARHANCPGCRYHATDEKGDEVWKLDTKVLEKTIVAAYEGSPPLTEPTKQKGGTFSGGGNVSRSKQTLEDSMDPQLTAWAQYNEWATLKNKDLKIFEAGTVHCSHGVANTLRQTAYKPNILNFRRTGFLCAVCDECGLEMPVDPKEHKKIMKENDGKFPCPECGK